MSTPTAYQRVGNVAVTPSDYDADPTKFPYYLAFDGVSDWLQTASIDFTATDKMSVFAGVRKLSDAAVGILVELTTAAFSQNGGFVVGAPDIGATYSFGSRGTVFSLATTATSYPSPITNVLTGTGDISGDAATLRANGVSAASSTADQGTGNYANAALYIGRRGGTSAPFNGRLYSLIVRGALTDAATIASAETYVATKTGVVLP